MTFKIAQLSDSHLGYSSGVRTFFNGTVETGVNQRVIDGYRAFRETIDQIIEWGPDLVIHSGDVFHKSWPDVMSVRWAQDQLLRLYKAGIPVYLLIGNHDAPSEKGKNAGPEILNDPDRGIHVISTPSAVIRPLPGLSIHALTHMGLASREVPDLTPVDGEISILTAHGAAAVPGTPVFHCASSPNELPLDVSLLARDWNAGLLGHYHGQGPIPGYPHIAYAGSAIPRGFSDPRGVPYGWLAWTVTNTSATFESRAVKQRPVIDLPRVDATNMTADEVTDVVRAHLEAVSLDGAIVRQVVENITSATERAVDRQSLNKIADPALMWKPVFRRPEKAAVPAQREEGKAAPTGTLAELPNRFADFVDTHAEELSVPETIRPDVTERGVRHLRGAVIDLLDTESAA